MTGIVTVETGHLGSVFTAIIHVLMDNLGMTFYTIGDLQYRICGLSVTGSNAQSQGQENDCCENDFWHTFPPSKHVMCVEMRTPFRSRVLPFILLLL